MNYRFQVLNAPTAASAVVSTTKELKIWQCSSAHKFYSDTKPVANKHLVLEFAILGLRALRSKQPLANLESDVRSASYGGAFEKFLTLLVRGTRDEADSKDENLVEEDVTALHEAVEK